MALLAEVEGQAWVRVDVHQQLSRRIQKLTLTAKLAAVLGVSISVFHVNVAGVCDLSSPSVYLVTVEPEERIGCSS